LVENSRFEGFDVSDDVRQFGHAAILAEGASTHSAFDYKNIESIILVSSKDLSQE
jgi:hypothetical protein